MMLARMLRIGVGLEAVAAITLVTVLGAWMVPPLAVALILMFPIAVHGIPLAIEFITGAIVDRRRSRG